MQKTSAGLLLLEYAVEGDLCKMHIPGHRPACRADGLWQHTCFEAFLMSGQGYFEFNFAPSTAWAIYHFGAYREGMSAVQAAGPPNIALELDTRSLRLNATIDLSGLSPSVRSENASLALAAVIEEQGGSLSYWALAHPPGKPDFHHRDNFALRFDLTDFR
ncbi:DOMON-like domain-containing protein [Methylocaldum marinum]|nr:DOMON-like domain-containing protein [Methylocaldum marinum]